jgi:hypothetical protein
MKKVIFCIVVLFNLPAWAIDYNDFPLALQQLLDQRTADLASKGGIFVAGNVAASDGAYFGSGKELRVNFYQGVDAPLEIYDSGWFIMKRTLQPIPDYGLAKLILRAFGYDPIDATIVASEGKITYLEYVMQKTPPENLTTITGIVTNDQNEPVGGVSVYLTFPHAYYADENPLISVTTEPNGRYSFEKLSSTEYHLYIPITSDYAGGFADVTPAKGKTTIKNIELYPNLGIVIDYVYQANGSRDFNSGDLRKGTIKWANGSDGVDFSDGRVKGYEPNSLRDIDMSQNQDVLSFSICYGNGKQNEQRNGFYDAGDVDFESVKEASETGYSEGAKPCKVGHTYVVRTFEGNYAKFVVKSISEE